MENTVTLSLKKYKELVDYETRFMCVEYKKIVANHWDDEGNVYLEICSDNDTIKILSDKIKDYDIRLNLLRRELDNKKESIKLFNNLPFYKRIFRKI